MTDTPRCDAAENKEAWRDPNQWVTELQVAWDLARQLERELAAMRMLAAEPHYIGKVKEALGPLSLWDPAGLEAEIAARVKLAMKGH